MSETSESSATSARNARIDATAREMFVMWCSRVNGPPSEGYTRVIAQNAYAFATALEGARADVIGASVPADDEKRTRDERAIEIQRAIAELCDPMLWNMAQSDRWKRLEEIRGLVVTHVTQDGQPDTWVPKGELEADAQKAEALDLRTMGKKR